MSAVVTIALASFSSYLALNDIVALKSTLMVIEGNWKWHHSIGGIRVPIRLAL